MVAQVQNLEGLEGTVGMRDEGWLPGGGGTTQQSGQFFWGCEAPEDTEGFMWVPLKRSWRTTSSGASSGEVQA